MKTSYSDVLRTALVSALRQESLLQVNIPHEAKDQRQLLGDVMITSDTHHWKQTTLDLIDKLYESENNNQNIISVQNIPISAVVNINTDYTPTRVSLWRGDMTRLRIDAVVNAANDGGLGCFVPGHKCLDNVLHRAAGPRLRKACYQAMKQRHHAMPLLTTGSPPIVTPGFHLPCDHVIHVTGPQIHAGKQVTPQDESNLQSAYISSLEAAVGHGAKSIAFPCISTGLFGYPPQEAAQVAVSAVRGWLEDNPGKLDAIVFDVFTDLDEKIYQEGIQLYFDTTITADGIDMTLNSNNRLSMTDKMNKLATAWIKDSDAILVCAGAGMSVKEGEMVYTNPDDFAKFYPFMLQYGYHTAYEAMSLFADPKVPLTAKWAFWALHLSNMRFRFTPNKGYNYLRQLIGDKEHFVVTSNVDGCFERAGFDPARIYTPQGEYAYLQCMRPCQHDSVFEAKPYLDKLVSHISPEGHVPPHMIPKCPRCGSDMFGNVRGGSWFLHHQYTQQNQAAIEWMQRMGDNHRNVVVIEVGAGFNTPMVTRWPMESFVREMSGKLIRINPSDPEIPSDLKGLSYAEGWQILKEILEATTVGNDANEAAAEELFEWQAKEGRLSPLAQTRKVKQYMGHFDWKQFLESLCR